MKGRMLMRRPTDEPEPRKPRPAALVVAAALVAAVGIIVVISLSDESLRAADPTPTHPGAPWTPPETITVWPENPMTDATPQQAQDAVDAGDATLSWRTDPQRFAQRFGLFVLGWSDTQVAPATVSGGAASRAGETFAIRPKCDGDEGANQPCGYSEPLLVRVAQPLRQGAGGIWSVVAVQAPGLDIEAPSSAHPTVLPGGATIRFDLRVPRDRDVHIGLVARNGCSATTSLSPGLEGGRHTLTLDEATRSVDADLACGAIGAGYVFAYVQADTTVPVGDPLLEAATIEYPWISIMPVTVEMIGG
jgi:hypothetical protein